jgi:hypothetical protein
MKCHDRATRSFSAASSAIAAGAAGASVAGLGVARAQAKTPQKAVKYQDTPKGDQRCENCKQFQPPSACKVVDGTISPQGWCTVYIKA